jgi:hypothetical protein
MSPYYYDCRLERLPYGERLVISPVWRAEDNLSPRPAEKRLSWWRVVWRFTQWAFRGTYE